MPQQANDQEQNQTPAVSPENLPKTTGEKYYGWLKFGVAEVTILMATALIAFWARHGADKPYNIFKKMQDWFEKRLSPLEKIGSEGSKTREAGTVFAKAGASTMVTFHGGNVFSPAMKWFDNKKDAIVDYFNKRFGEPGELEIGRERMKDDPKQNWGDVLKGRLMAWAIVFASFLSIMLVVGKDKKIGKEGMYYFDKAEEWFGRKLAGLTKGGKELGKLSVAEFPNLKESHPQLAQNRTYRFGKILALDIYATTAAIAIWNVCSELFARKRHKKEQRIQEISASLSDTQQAVQSEQELGRGYADDISTQQEKPEITRNASHAKTLRMQREVQESREVQLGV